MDAPFKPTMQSKHDIGASDRGARKFDAKDKDDPFGDLDETRHDTNHTGRGSMLDDKFDLERLDLLDEMNQTSALLVK